MTDRLTEIRIRLAKVDACRVKHYICAGCDGDIETADAHWLIMRLEGAIRRLMALKKINRKLKAELEKEREATKKEKLYSSVLKAENEAHKAQQQIMKPSPLSGCCHCRRY